MGELLTVDGHPPAIVEAGNKATKAFGKIAEELFVNDDQLASYKGIPFMTSQGPIKCSLKGKIS